MTTRPSAYSARIPIKCFLICVLQIVDSFFVSFPLLAQIRFRVAKQVPSLAKYSGHGGCLGEGWTVERYDVSDQRIRYNFAACPIGTETVLECCTGTPSTTSQPGWACCSRLLIPSSSVHLSCYSTTPTGCLDKAPLLEQCNDD